MPKRFKITVAIIVALVVGAMGWQAGRTREPMYQGRTLTSWLEEYSRLTGPGMSSPVEAEVELKKQAATRAETAIRRSARKLPPRPG